jgi:2,3-bisphosphoglycerate-independent phosphoglycerate mutase
VVDRRAGRIDTKTSAALAKRISMKLDNVDAIFQGSVEHRGALVLRGAGLSSNVSPTDAHEGEAQPPCHALDDSPEAKRTAELVNRFTRMAASILSASPENEGRKCPANAVLLRGAGNFVQVPSFHQRFGLHSVCIAGGALYRGVASFMGMDLIIVPGATGDKNSNLEAKARAAAKAIDSYDMVFLHIKMCDSFSHDGDFKGKAQAIEKIDRVIPILEKTGASIIVTGDHSTPVSLRNHSGHEVPILVYRGERSDDVSRFDEISCAKGGLGHIRGKDVVPLILNITGRAAKYGS